MPKTLWVRVSALSIFTSAFSQHFLPVLAVRHDQSVGPAIGRIEDRRKKVESSRGKPVVLRSPRWGLGMTS